MEQANPKHENNMRNYLRDLVRNENFLKLAKEKVRLLNEGKPKPEHIQSIYKKLIANELERRELISLLRATSAIENNEDFIEMSLAGDYGIDMKIFTLLLCEIDENSKLTLTRKYPDYTENIGDLIGFVGRAGSACRLDNDEDLINRAFGTVETESRLPYELEKIGLFEKIAYPVSIRIHRTASHNEVVDFIDKNWRLVEQQLENAREDIIKRKDSRRDIRIGDIIYDNRDEESSYIKSILEKEVPKNNTTKQEITKIKNEEIKKRNADIRLFR